MIPFIVLPISRLPNFAEKTAYTQMKGDIRRYVLSTSSHMGDIGEPRYRLNNKGYQILWKGYWSILDYLDSLIPQIVLPKSWLPDVAQKTTCNQNVAMVFTFHLRYVPAFNNVYILRDKWKNAKILFLRFFWNTLYIVCINFLIVIWFVDWILVWC